jgi:hypothetical protein
MAEFKLIPVDEIPFRVMGEYPVSDLSRIIKEFDESENKLAYIQLGSKRELQLVSARCHMAASRWAKKVIVREYMHLLRIYLIKMSEILDDAYDDMILDKVKLIATDSLPEGRRHRGWSALVREFIESGNKIAYIEFKNKEELLKARGGISSAVRRISKNIKLSQYSHLLKIYFERTDL